MPPGHSTAAIAEGTPRITFLDLYKIAHRQHRPHGLLHNAHVVLYRAQAGTGAPDDMPFSEQFSDCALGWGARVADGVEILDGAGRPCQRAAGTQRRHAGRGDPRRTLYRLVTRAVAFDHRALPAVAESDDRPPAHWRKWWNREGGGRRTGVTGDRSRGRDRQLSHRQAGHRLPC
ncbi:hypothetical protein QP162_08895 [Sphingomonas aurantiaca]|uniref:hypothetical protein n=1 Tax=Sphingomonas aurantiaca TaxID=185949 RepID=UPI002FDFBF10